ncbi:mismatch-specific DNA-glycosylase [Lentimicrobium sp. S6]|uniref:mismatch-specific DNA-glycosylase n=1 Tax=Lentimicrobium sp. S6 TaxID=2735872 RepID=UPI001557F89F|nr:mismatch-specific DNA-glycosylase [Lentimicrobium sp. S6]NPD47610.1 mismatch-specific DNA-glycosylase [Lentimicrobium sp. S6]
MVDSEKIRQINKVVAKCFEVNTDVQKTPAKNLMPEFIKAGIFNKDQRGGLPIREILRELDTRNELSRIPYVLPERKKVNTYWYFVPIHNAINNDKSQLIEANMESKSIPEVAKPQDVLDDLITDNLNVVFCGTAVGNKSGEKKLYYAGIGNKFYKTLFEIGLIPRVFLPEEYKQLIQYGIGLTDLAKRKSGNDIVVDDDDFDVKRFLKAILKFKPKVVCFNGKAAASVYLFGTKDQTRDVEYGILDKKIGETQLFVAPSTSGSANAYWDIDYWKQIIDLIA